MVLWNTHLNLIEELGINPGKEFCSLCVPAGGYFCLVRVWFLFFHLLQTTLFTAVESSHVKPLPSWFASNHFASQILKQFPDSSGKGGRVNSAGWKPVIRIYRGRRPDQGRPGFSSLWKEFTKPWKNCTGKLSTLFSGQPGGGMNMICLGLGSSVNECGPLDKQAEPQRLLFLTWATLPCTAAHLGKLETLIFFLLATGSTFTPLAHHNRRSDIAHIFVYSSRFFTNTKPHSVCLWVCLYVSIYVCLCVCICLHMHTSVYMYVHLHMCTPVCVCLCVYICAPLSLSLCFSLCICIQAHT